jgi:predicted transcriptional regulator
MNYSYKRKKFKIIMECLSRKQIKENQKDFWYFILFNELNYDYFFKKRNFWLVSWSGHLVHQFIF